MKSAVRKPTLVRRREIAEAALRVIGERGATSLTVAVLAAEVGVTPGALYRHFCSVDEILETATDLAVERVEASFPASELPAIVRLRRLAEKRLTLFAAVPGLSWLLLSDQVYLTVPEAAIQRLRALAVRSRAYIQEALRQGIADGSLRAGLDAEALLVIFTGTIHALARRPGVHATISEPLNQRVSRVLDALFTLIGPSRRDRHGADHPPGEPP